MRNWQADAPRVIASIHASLQNPSPDELRRALRKHSQSFSYGTSWGKKVWAKHCKIYLARLEGGASLPATEWPADICFPFREEPNS